MKTYIVISDVHVPFHDHNAMEAVCSLARDVQPTGLVVAGDFLDFYELSSHNRASLANLEGKRISDTFEGANNVLGALQEAAGPQATDNYFLDGNHEDRLRRWLASGDNAVWIGDEAVDMDRRLGLRKRGFSYRPGYPESHVELGHLLVTHGRWCTRNHAATHLDRFRKSVMYGHTHTPQVHYGPAWKAQQVAIGLGHLANVDSPAMSYAGHPNGWCQGFAMVHVFKDSSFQAAPINFWRGQFVHGGKTYGRRKGK